jgi:ATP-binding cassette subfamily B protein
MCKQIDIAIARAAIRQAPIVILDEATTGLDKASEYTVNKLTGRLSPRQVTRLLILWHDCL